MIVLFLSPTLPFLVQSLRTRQPDRTAMMGTRLSQGRFRAGEIRSIPVPLNQIAPLLRTAVVLAEDARFYQHNGIDLAAIQEAFWTNVAHGEVVRGGSTITQQLCKNLFLRPEPRLSRKLREALLALYLETMLEKRRILELYLNVIEWGPGIFGIEAAAKHYFNKSALSIGPEEVALLVAMIPSPLLSDPRNPSPWLSARSNQILNLLEKHGAIEPGTVPW